MITNMCVCVREREREMQGRTYMKKLNEIKKIQPTQILNYVTQNLVNHVGINITSNKL